MSLRDGTKKMSKSDPSDYSRINLTDDADTIAQKVRKAKTDPEPLPSEAKGLEDGPEADNLVGDLRRARRTRTTASVLREYGGAQFSAFKAALVDVAVGKLAPIADEMRRLTADPGLYRCRPRRRLRAGARHRRPNMDAIKDILGFVRAR